MIVHRKELEGFGSIKLRIVMGDISSREIEFPIKFAMDYINKTENSFDIELGDKLIKIINTFYINKEIIIYKDDVEFVGS